MTAAVSRLLACAYDRTVAHGWLAAQQAVDAVCVLLRMYGPLGPRETMRQLFSLDVAQDADLVLDLLASLEARSWEIPDYLGQRESVEIAIRSARVELLAAVEAVNASDRARRRLLHAASAGGAR